MNWKRLKIRLFGGGRHIVAFVRSFVQRCLQDRVTVTAGHLTYVSLLSLVPLLAVMIGFMAVLPAFETIRDTLQQAVLDNLVPASGEAVQDYVGTFIENARQLSAIGVVFLFVVAIMLMNNIDKSMNRIWRVEKKRRFVVSLAVYWMILTMGPILVGISIGASSYLLTAASEADEYVQGLLSLALTLAPLVTTTAAFLLMYVLIPNKVVKVRHAVWGALVAAILFEIAKNGFGLYLHYFPTYERVYGAVATIPILIVWIFLSWNIILIGAEVTATVEEYVGAEEELTEEEKGNPDALYEPDEQTEGDVIPEQADVSDVSKDRK